MSADSGIGDTQYIWSIQVNTAPAIIDLAAALDGWAMPDRTRPFACLEIGCGHGLTLAALAAAYPKGRFVGIEPNTAHVASARALAADAGLANLVIIEAEAGACLEMGLGPFDLVTLHGVYSWVAAPARADMVTLIDRTLAPGGRVYVSYNALPGQAPLARLRGLLLTEAGEGEPIARAKRGIGRLAARLEAEDPAIMDDIEVATLIAWLARQDPRYVVHELMPDGWESLPVARVALDFARAGLVFAASLPLAKNFVELCVPPPARTRLRPAPDRIAWEGAKDEATDTRFRRDVYVRPAGRKSDRVAILAPIPFVSAVHPGRACDRIDLGGATVSLDQRHLAVRAILAEGPASPAAIAAATGFALAEAVDVLLLLAAAGQAAPMIARPRRPASPPLRLGRANQALLTAGLASGGAVALASPVLGAVFPLERDEALWLQTHLATPQPAITPLDHAMTASLDWLAELGIVEGG